jgi:hypothetical protein
MKAALREPLVHFLALGTLGPAGILGWTFLR